MSDRLEQLKKEAIENPPVKVKGCKSCKKKKEVVVEANTELPVAITEYIPTIDEIKSAYVELGNPNLTEEQKKFINKVYKAIFNEDFDFTCVTCRHKQGIIFGNHLRYNLNINI